MAASDVYDTEDLEMNMTPMIDVVFLLIIFFMIVTEISQLVLEELQLPYSKIAKDDEAGLIGKNGMVADGAIQLGGFQAACDLIHSQTAGLEERSGQVLGHDEVIGAATNRDVLETGMEADGQIGRKGPGRRGPNDDGDVAQALERGIGIGVAQGEAHVNGIRSVGMIFDLGFGERRAEDRVPVHGPHPFDDQPLFHEFSKQPQNTDFVLVRIGFVRAVPVAHYAEAFELLALQIDVLARIFFAQAAHFDRFQIVDL